jgi:hypothetical protein
MNLLRTFIHAYLYIPFFYQKLTRAAPFGNKGARPISSPLSSNDNALKSALFRHYVRQYHEASCSVASVVTVVNALRSGEKSHLTPITQMDILDRVRVGHWKERMSEKGYNGRRGVPLALLGEMVKKSLEVYELPYLGVETVQASLKPGEAQKIRAALLQRLMDFETKGNGLLIAHFNQGVYLPTLGIPHISPVGGFDSGTGQVTLLDVDASRIGGPYRIGFDTFYLGLACTYNPVFRHLGYKNGGYVFVKLH